MNAYAAISKVKVMIARHITAFAFIAVMSSAAFPAYAASLSLGGGTLTYSESTSKQTCSTPGGSETIYTYTVSTFTSASGAVTTFNTSGGYYLLAQGCFGVTSEAYPTYVTLTGSNFTIKFYPGSNGTPTATYSSSLTTPTISVSSSGTPSNYGSAVTFTATISPSADTNTVAFYNGGTLLGTVTPSQGTAKLTTSSLAGGSDSITAGIAAGGSYAGATSSAITQVVNLATTSISVSSSGSPSSYGSPVTFNATVTSGDTNTVIFYNGSTWLGTATPNSGTATLMTSSLPAGSNSITATITAGGNYYSSTSSAFIQAVTSAPPTVDGLSPSSGAPGATITISGDDFAPFQGTSTVTFNGKSATISSWSNASIVAAVPTGATTGNLIVTVSGAGSNGVEFTVLTAVPAIASLSPSSGPAGTPINISGSNFGSTEGQGTVTFNGATAGVLNWSDSSITVVVPSGVTTGPVVVTLPNGQTSNNNTIFTAKTSSCN